MCSLICTGIPTLNESTAQCQQTVSGNHMIACTTLIPLQVVHQYRAQLLLV